MQTTTVAMAFASMLVLPFLSVLSLFDNRAFAYALRFWGLWVAIAFVLLAGAGFGVTPMGPGDVVTREQADAWFSRPLVQEMMYFGIVGLMVGTPFLLLTWAYQSRIFSVPLKLLVHIAEIIGLGVAAWKFTTLYLMPYLHDLHP